VVNFAQPGAVFIQRGEMWRIAEIDDEARVKVSPIEDPAGEVPSWTGQEIPVPAAVAGEVGEIRSVAEPQLAAGADAGALSKDLAYRYPADEYTLTQACGQLERHVAAEAPMPTADRLVIERQGRTIVLNAPFGHMINETLGRLLSSLLGQQAGSSVGLETDPYRIELEVPSSVATSDVLAVLEDTDPDHVEAIIELGLKRSDALAFRLAQVSAKFGALKRWQNNGSGRLSSKRLLAALEDTRCTPRRSARCSTRISTSIGRVRSSGPPIGRTGTRHSSGPNTGRTGWPLGWRQGASGTGKRGCERDPDGQRASAERPNHSTLYPLHGMEGENESQTRRRPARMSRVAPLGSHR